MEKELNRDGVEMDGERIRVILPVNMAEPRDKVLEGSVNGAAFIVPRGVGVWLTAAQYEVLRASGRVPIY